MGKFTATIAEWATKSEKGMAAIRNESVKRVIQQAQTPTAQGGNMRVDTGFLRSSGQLSFSGMPTGPVRPAPDAAPNQYGFDVSPVALQLAGAGLNTTLYWGWTANYAKYREWHDAFLRLAVQNWPTIVNTVTNDIKKRYGL